MGGSGIGDDRQPGSLARMGTLLVFVMAADYIPMPLVTLMLVAYLVWHLINNAFAVPQGILRLLWLPGLLLLLGLPGFLYNDPGLALRDVWHFGKYPLVMSFGYLWARKSASIRHTLDTCMVVSGIACSVFLLAILSGQAPLHVSLGPLPQKYGRAPHSSLLGAAIVPLATVYGVRLPRARKLVGFLVFAACVLCMAISESRTLMGATLLVTGLLVFVRLSSSMKVLLLVVIVGFGLVSARVIAERAAVSDWTSLASKMTHTLKEISPQAHQEQVDITHFWRGYETAMAWREYTAGGFAEKIFGGGFGEEVDIGVVMQLGVNEYRRIPVLHNGYLTLLVKTGLLGLVLHVAFLASLGGLGRRNLEAPDKERRFAGRLLMALVAVLFIVTFVITGLPSLYAAFPVSVLMGALVAHLDRPVRGTPRQLARA